MKELFIGNPKYLFSEGAALQAGARRSRRFHVNLNKRVLFLERLENIRTVKRRERRAPLNTYNPVGIENPYKVQVEPAHFKASAAVFSSLFGVRWLDTALLLSGFLGLCLSVLVLSARAGAEVGSSSRVTQSALKAGWVFNFLRSTDWPQDAPNSSAPYVLGILGEDPFGEDLLKKFAQQKVKNRPIAIKRCSSVDEAKACHVVFISASEKERLAEILNALQDASVLTIGDTDEFARLGGIIGLTIGKEQAFEINHAALKRSKLNIDSRVLLCGKLLR